jgi:predicted amidophosphoribosyltransferase
VLSYLGSVSARLLSGFADVWLPHACAHCGLPGEALCRACAVGAVRGFASPRCPRCAGPAGGVDPECVFCRSGVLAGVLAAAPYVEPWRTWLHVAKFGPAPSLAEAMALRLVERLRATLPTTSAVIVPVPRGNRGGVLRGPSLPWVLAGFWSRRLGVPRLPLVERRRPGRPQRLLGRGARAVLGAADFELVAPLPAGCTEVLLVDDVMTTGATLAAVSGTLRAAQADLVVRAAVLARAGAPAGHAGLPDAPESETCAVVEYDVSAELRPNL